MAFTPDPHPCEIRVAIEKRVTAAVREVYRVKELHLAGDPDAAAALTRARFDERDAERELRTHIEQHRCKKM
jgi:hypothetical protein